MLYMLPTQLSFTSCPICQIDCCSTCVQVTLFYLIMAQSARAMMLPVNFILVYYYNCSILLLYIIANLLLLWFINYPSHACIEKNVADTGDSIFECFKCPFATLEYTPTLHINAYLEHEVAIFVVAVVIGML